MIYKTYYMILQMKAIHQGSNAGAYIIMHMFCSNLIRSADLSSSSSVTCRETHVGGVICVVCMWCMRDSGAFVWMCGCISVWLYVCVYAP